MKQMLIGLLTLVLPVTSFALQREYTHIACESRGLGNVAGVIGVHEMALVNSNNSLAALGAINEGKTMIYVTHSKFNFGLNLRDEPNTYAPQVWIIAQDVDAPGAASGSVYIGQGRPDSSIKASYELRDPSVPFQIPVKVGEKSFLVMCKAINLFR